LYVPGFPPLCHQTNNDSADTYELGKIYETFDLVIRTDLVNHFISWKDTKCSVSFWQAIAIKRKEKWYTLTIVLKIMDAKKNFPKHSIYLECQMPKILIHERIF